MEEQKSLRDLAVEYVGKIAVVTELENFDIDNKIEQREGETSEGEKYFYNVVIIGKTPYRVPNSVIADIKVLLEDNPKLKKVKVISRGKGLDTRYTTIPIEKA